MSQELTDVEWWKHCFTVLHESFPFAATGVQCEVDGVHVICTVAQRRSLKGKTFFKTVTFAAVDGSRSVSRERGKGPGWHGGGQWYTV